MFINNSLAVILKVMQVLGYPFTKRANVGMLNIKYIQSIPQRIHHKYFLRQKYRKRIENHRTRKNKNKIVNKLTNFYNKW